MSVQYVSAPLPPGVPVLANTTPQFSDFDYNLNDDGLLCGPPRQQPVNPPTPPPAPPCIPPSFAPYTLSGTIDGSSTSPNRGPAYFNKLLTFEGTAGDMVSLWYHVPPPSEFSAYMYLMDPSNNLLAQSGTGETPFTEDSDCSIVFELPTTGTYTIDCTTYDVGDMGSFEVYVSPGPEKFTNLIGYAKNQCIVIPETNRIFCISFAARLIGEQIPVELLDATTLDYVGNAPLPIQYVFANAPGAFYNTNDNSVWILSFNDAFSQQFWLRLDPTTGALLEEFLAFTEPDTLDFMFSFVPDKNHYYGIITGAFGNATDLVIYDCTSRTVIDTIPFPVAGLAQGAAYDQETGRVIMGVFPTMYAIDTTTHAMTVFAPGQCINNNIITYNLPINGRVIYGNDSNLFARITALNLDTGAVVFTSVAFNNMDDMQWNPCLECLEVTTESDGSTPGVISNVTRVLSDGSILSTATLFDTDQFSEGVLGWLPAITRTFVMAHGNPITVVPAFTYIL